MPELPEVECTARYLAERVSGRTILAVRVLWPRSVECPALPRFRRLATGAVITGVGRRGKFVLFQLEAPRRGGGIEKLSLFAHMRMSGSFDVLSTPHPVGKHDRVVISLSGGSEIHFNDPRKFGRFYLVSDPHEVVGELGPEPIGATGVEEARFIEIVRARRGRIKTVLLNQRVLAGLGNIYVDEALWRSRIDPRCPAEDLSARRLAALFHAITGVLVEAIAAAGTDFGDGVVEAGMYRPRVYGREGEPCERCERPIRRIVLAQRGTHLCGRCQR